MKIARALFTASKVLLFACVSMYFGTGWSLVLFSFPGASELTPGNYYAQFVPQVTAATVFFRAMTIVMMICCIILVIEEWHSRLKWYGVSIFLAIILATALTIVYIFPYNRSMEAGISSQQELRSVLTKWMRLNIIRVSIWTVQWLLMMFYFLVKTRKAQPGPNTYVP
jgi:hypothetical protein